MKLTIFSLLLVSCYAFPAEVEKDNKAVESKSVKSVAPKETEKSAKTEKRAPVVQTIVPGELKYGADVKYGSEVKYTPQYVQAVPEVRYVASSDAKNAYYDAPQPSPKPQYLFYGPHVAGHGVPASSASSPAAASVPTNAVMHLPPHAQLILMLAVPHPSGQYMMLFPAQNFLYPMYYRHPVHQSANSIPVPSYQVPAASAYQPAYQPSYSAPALAQHAGFVAQHQLAYGGPTSPYRTEKYSPSKQQ